ncbi:MAG: type I phosphomannose isomerase catalytic subunit [Eubacteriales bacterium]
MNILKLNPNPVDYIIDGGTLINEFLNLDDHSTPSQLWVASLLEENLPNGKNGLSTINISPAIAESLSIQNAPSDEKEQVILFKDVIASKPDHFLGKSHADKYGNSLGILLKLLNSKDRLLVQAHPTLAQAQEFFGPSAQGKTEAWYVLATSESASLYIGFKKFVTREYFEDLIEQQDTEKILDCLHCFPLTPGDIIVVPANTPHAMGGGSLVAEIQEPSPITLRAECIRPDGCVMPRESLHSGIGVSNMLNCFDFTTRSEEETRKTFFVDPIVLNENESQIMPTNMDSFFGMHEITCKTSYEKTNSSFVVGLVLDGEGTITSNGLTQTIKKGEEFFIPHLVTSYQYNGTLRLIECYPPKA